MIDLELLKEETPIVYKYYYNGFTGDSEKFNRKHIKYRIGIVDRILNNRVLLYRSSDLDEVHNYKAGIQSLVVSSCHISDVVEIVDLRDSKDIVLKYQISYSER